MLHSRFRFAVAAPVLLFALLTLILFFLFPVMFYLDAGQIPVFIYFSLLIFGFIWAWILFGMLRQHTITIALDETTITVRPFLGLGKKRSYLLSDFGGYSILPVPPWNRHREAVYLQREGKPAIKLHGHYLKNYDDLATFVTARIPDSGPKTFSQWEEVKDAFRQL